MSGMNIDLRIIRGWAHKWEECPVSIKRASQMAAVMLSKALAENEARAARGEKLLKEIITEINLLNRIERKCPRQPRDPSARKLSFGRNVRRTRKG